METKRKPLISQQKDLYFEEKDKWSYHISRRQQEFEIRDGPWNANNWEHKERPPTREGMRLSDQRRREVSSKEDMSSLREYNKQGRERAKSVGDGWPEEDQLTSRDLYIQQQKERRRDVDYSESNHRTIMGKRSYESDLRGRYTPTSSRSSSRDWVPQKENNLHDRIRQIQRESEWDRQVKRAPLQDIQDIDYDARPRRDQSDNTYSRSPKKDYWGASNSNKQYLKVPERSRSNSSTSSSTISSQTPLTPIQEIENPLTIKPPKFDTTQSPIFSPIHEVDLPESLRAILEYNPPPNQSLEETFANINSRIEKSVVLSDDSSVDPEPIDVAREPTPTEDPVPATRVLSAVVEKSTTSQGQTIPDRFRPSSPFRNSPQEKPLLLATLLVRLNNKDVDVNLFRQLIRLSKDTPLSAGATSAEIWESGDRYGELLQALLIFMDDPEQQDPELKENVLLLILQLLINQTEYLKGHERDILRVLLECRADPANNVCAQADEVLETFVELVDTQIGLYVLIDIMESEIVLGSAFGLSPSTVSQKRPRSWSNPKRSAFLCMYKLIQRFDKNSLARQIGKVLPLAIRGFNDPKPEIRKSVVDSLVLIHSVIGDDKTMHQYLRTLSPEKQKLLNYYFDKSQKRHQRAPSELKVQV